MSDGLFDIAGIFEAEPKLPFFGALENQNLSPIQRQFFRTRFNDFFNRFTGQTANFLSGGGDPAESPSFTDFLQGPVDPITGQRSGGINFRREFQSRPPSLRPGGGTAQFSPPTRFLF